MTKARDVFFVFLGVVGLVLKRQYSGTLEEVIHSYAGNFAASFAVYFIVKNIPFRSGYKKVLTAGLALGVVQLFEVFDGFGVMTNVYDPVDFVANFAGIALALAVDAVLDRPLRRTPAQKAL